MPRGRIAQPLLPRLMKYVREAESGCWEWTGCRNRQGYGKTNILSVYMFAHRAMWIATHGEIPDGLCVLHRCDNPPCVNPAHLFLGTYADNTADMFRKGRFPVDSRRGENSNWAKLTTEQVGEIKALIGEQRLSQMNIATRFGVSQTCVSQIARGKSWAWL